MQTEFYFRLNKKIVDIRSNTMVQVVWVVALVCFLHGPQFALSQTPWRINTTSKYELRFYDSAARNFDTAKSLCASSLGIMVRMDNAEVRRTVGDTVKSASVVKTFWIGARRYQNSHNWQWLDGTFITSSLLVWYGGQPDNSDGNDNYLIIRKSDAKYGDVKYHFAYAGTICQRPLVVVHSLRTSGLVFTETSTKQMNCSADGYPAPAVMWKSGNSEITTSSVNGGLYQIKYTGRAKLMVKNAKVTDEGQYTCVAFNTVGSLQKIVLLTVPSKPTILNIQPMSCNSSLSVMWKPHSRTAGVGHWIRVSENGGGSFVREVPTPEDSLVQTFVTENLNSSALYTITIAVVCDSCINSYSDSGKNYTGGIPRQVETPTLKQLNGSCEVIWSWPKITPKSYITGFKVRTIFVTERVDSGSKIISEVDEKVINPNLSFSIPKHPNRHHTVFITSQTCAGFGEAVVAKGSCITDVAAPDSVEKLIGRGKEIPRNGRMHLSMKVPSDANGPISCIFVIVEIGSCSNLYAANEDGLTKVNNSETADSYIAIAADKQTMGGEVDLKITLGDDSVTRCNIHTRPKTQTTRADNSGNYVGQNKALSKGKVYNFYIVTSTPSDGGKVFFRTSDSLQVIVPDDEEDKTNHDASVSSIVFFGVGAALLVLSIICLVAAACIFKRKRKLETPTTAEQNNTYEYPTVPMGLKNEAGYENAGSGMSVGQAQTDTAYETFYDIEQEVKQEPSSNPEGGNLQAPERAYEFVK